MATVTKEQRNYAVSRIRETGTKKVATYKERSCRGTQADGCRKTGTRLRRGGSSTP